MCGVVGIYAHSAKVGVAQNILECMRDTMSHRGPDGAATWLSGDRRVGLGHRRLSIVDLSERAAQPMPNEDGDIWVTFNGEIYNHGLLRSELEAAGHRFRTDHSDTEVLLHGFEQWSISGLLNRIAGDFAFALYDARHGMLYLARDRIGVKPLYFSDFGGAFAFASEIKAILAHPSVERDIDPIAMVHYLSFLSTPAPMTMFKGVYKLPAGCWLQVARDGGVQMRRYYSAQPGRGFDPAEISNLSETAVEHFFVDGIRNRLASAVERRMMADVPMGVFLSGGIDSSTNVALMSRFSDRPINTFTVGYKQYTEINELHYARMAAERFQTNHHEVLVGEDDMLGYLESLVHHQDEPLADWVCIPLYFVSKRAHDAGVKVVQVGEGSDEQFSGYEGYLRYLMLYERFWKPYRRYLPGPLRSTIASFVSLISGAHPRLPFYADIVQRAAHNREFFWILSMTFWDAYKNRLIRPEALGTGGHHMKMVDAGVLEPGYLAPDSFNVIKSYAARFDDDNPHVDALTRMTYNEFRLRLPELLLMRVDKIGMSVSIEPRVPFLDQELVDFTFDIPQAWKIRDGIPKYLLKRAVRGIIPDELIDRKKMGFDAPMALWLKGTFGESVEAQIRASGLMSRGFFNIEYIANLFRAHRRGKANFAQHIWTLYNLSAWYDYWIDGKRLARAA